MTEIVLPDLILLELHQGDVEIYLEHLYEVFKNDFLSPGFSVGGKRVSVRHKPKFKDKEECFWHITSEGDGDNRNPNMRRCERMKWIKILIQEKDSGKVCVWNEARSTNRGAEIRTHICLKDFSYLVVLEERSNYWLFITAYPIEREHQRKKLEKRYRECKS